MPRRKNNATEENKEYVRIRDNYTCVYCGGSGYDVDHVIPASKGGLNIKGNLVCACKKCNGKKHNFLDINMITRGLFWLSTHGEDTSWVDKIELPKKHKYTYSHVKLVPNITLKDIK